MRPQAVNATGREMVLESCNCGGKAGRPSAILDCPYNMYRTGIDIAPSPLSTVSNLLDSSECVASLGPPPAPAIPLPAFWCMCCLASPS